MGPVGAARRAVVVGATGLVGADLVRQLLADERFAAVATLVRRAGASPAPPKLVEHVVDFDAPDAWAPLVAGDVLFSALGTTMRAAGSQAAQYRVDHGYQLAAARAARANRVPTYVLAAGNPVDPGEAYRAFRGRDARIDALMRDRGFPVPGAAPATPAKSGR